MPQYNDTPNDRPFVLHTRMLSGNSGGPEKTILNSPRYLRQHGFDSACLFLKPAGEPACERLTAQAESAGAEIMCVDDNGRFDRNIVKQCIRICRERNVDVWHAHDRRSTSIGLLVRHFYRMHLVTTAHRWIRFAPGTALHRWKDRFCLRRYDRVICSSPDLFDSCRRLRVQADRLSLIDNGIVTDDYDPSPPQPIERRRFGFGSDHIVLGAVGRLSETSGFDHLISAVGRLVGDGHSVGLLIAGDGPLKNELQQQIDNLELQNHVRLVGFLDAPRNLYRAIDVFVLSNTRADLPNVVLEAMASQRAVVATNVSGVSQLLSDGENGIVVEPDNEDSLYHGMRTCIDSSERMYALAANGRKTVEQRFEFAQRMDKVVSVYRELSPELWDGVKSAQSTERSVLEPVAV
jgi:glycosyltransferase involved in cell wall biosynthesis